MACITTTHLHYHHSNLTILIILLCLLPYISNFSKTNLVFIHAFFKVNSENIHFHTFSKTKLYFLNSNFSFLCLFYLLRIIYRKNIDGLGTGWDFLFVFGRVMKNKNKVLS